MVDIIQLAMEFGLPCIQRGNIFYIVGEKEIVELEFINSEEIERWQQKIQVY